MSDPFEPNAKPVEISLSLKPTGAYDASLINVKGTPEQLADLLKVETGEAFDKNPLWFLSLRWNDLARAVQADEAKKAAASGKA